MTETNIYALTVPGMYGKKKVIGRIIWDLIRLLLSIYLSIRRQKTSIYLYHFLVGKSNPNFTFPDLRHQKIGFPIFHSEWFGSRLVPAMDCFKRM